MRALHLGSPTKFCVMAPLFTRRWNLVWVLPMKLSLSSWVGIARSLSQGTVLATRRLTTARCNHEMLKSAAECLEAMVDSDNHDHFFIATQDAGLHRKCRQVPGVPIVLVQKNSLLLEPPSECQYQYVRMSEAKRTHMNEKEYKALENRMTKNIESHADGTSTHKMSEDELSRKIESEDDSNSRKMLAVKDHPRFKRKKAKETWTAKISWPETG